MAHESDRRRAQFRLTDMEVREVSLVDQAANKRKFIMLKRADGESVLVDPEEKVMIKDPVKKDGEGGAKGDEDVKGDAKVDEGDVKGAEGADGDVKGIEGADEATEEVPVVAEALSNLVEAAKSFESSTKSATARSHFIQTSQNVTQITADLLAGSITAEEAQSKVQELMKASVDKGRTATKLREVAERASALAGKIKGGAVDARAIREIKAIEAMLTGIVSRYRATKGTDGADLDLSEHDAIVFDALASSIEERAAKPTTKRDTEDDRVRVEGLKETVAKQDAAITALRTEITKLKENPPERTVKAPAGAEKQEADVNGLLFPRDYNDPAAKAARQKAGLV